MDNFTLNIAFAGLAALGTLAGGAIILAWPKAHPTFLQYFIALGAGFMLAAVFLEIVPESQKETINALSFVLGGYLLTHFMEHVVSQHFHFGEETHTEVMIGSTASITALLGLGVHALFDGASIGAGFAINSALGFLIFMAIVLHKIPEGFTIASIMLAAGRTKTVAFGAASLVGLITLLGAILAFTTSAAAPQVLSASAGVLIYVAATDLIPEINVNRQVMIPLTVLLGVLLFYFTRSLVPG